MHDGNPPSQPELLQFLADDFAAHGFDLRYLIRTIANSRVYQLSSRYPAGSPRPAEATFACGLVRPLTPWQLGVSLLVATGYYESEVASADATTRGKPGTLRARLEARHAARLAELARELDSGPGPYQPGVREALFQANSQAFADLVAKGGMATRLAALPDDAAVAEAFWCILARPPAADEAASVAGYLRARSGRRPAACQQVVWALLSSPEFRFNH